MAPDTPTPNQQMPSPISATAAPPLLVEAKRCEAKAPPKKFNTQARMSVGGKGLLWCKKKLAQAQREVVVISDEDEGEKRQDKEPPAPRRSLRLLGVKRKNYIEHTPEPKDYAGDSDWESYMSPGSWGAAGRDYDDDWPGWAKEERREDDNPSKGDRGKGKKKDDDKPKDDGPNRDGHHFRCCFKCRNEITDLRATIDRCHDRIVAMDRRMDDIESLAEKDYNFLVRNLRKLFGMVGDLQKQGGGRPRCNCPRCR